MGKLTGFHVHAGRTLGTQPRPGQVGGTSQL